MAIFLSGIQSSLLLDISLMIIVATIIAYLFRLIKQPTIPAYILTGILLGPSILNLIKDSADIAALSEIGIALLLFVVGLELDIRKFKQFGKISIFSGLSQVLFTGFVGFLISLGLGFTRIESLYLGLGLAFSSTVIVIKLLSDKDQIDTLHGRIAIGILIIQDIIAILFLLFLSTLNNQSSLGYLYSLIKGLILIFIFYLFTRFIFPIMFRRFAKSQEILFLASISACLFFAILAFGLGFSIAIGAFLAGIALASTTYDVEIISKMKPLRDFFSTIFFVSLGMQITFSTVSNMLPQLIILSLFVLIGNPLLALIIMRTTNFKKRTSFFIGMLLAQVSEFALILSGLGLSSGHLSKETSSLIVIITVLTMVISTYLISNMERLYKKFGKYLTIFEKKNALTTSIISKNVRYDIIVLGGNRTGAYIIKYLKNTKKKFLVIDYNPDVIQRLENENVDCIYGDASDEEIIKRINKIRPSMLISTMPSIDNNLILLEKIKRKNKSMTIFLTAKTVPDVIELYKKGADFVILPEILAGQKIADYLMHLKKPQIKKWGKHYYKKLLEDRKKNIV
ncbi:MAG TPA: cation:proton antiporter [Candidatus Nanoarchaeia archaeon]|nr:hypothetical protein [uncultured archaeon]AQS34198.1 hypothetical protein [uncultured archaeon]HLC55813.1 cation:proton antiporter [Candidatus Nanoarchaeia archaeon]